MENALTIGLVLGSLFLTGVVAFASQRAAIKYSEDCGDRFRAEYDKNKVQLDVHVGEAPPAWVAAQTLLHNYIANNVSQVRMIFWFSLFVILVGFGITCTAVMNVFMNTGTNGSFAWVQALPIIAGVLTQFIGATVLFLLRATNRSALAFVQTLDRMNTVGMAVCVVRSIPPAVEYDALRAATYAQLSRDLFRPDGLLRSDTSESAKPDDGAARPMPAAAG